MGYRVTVQRERAFARQGLALTLLEFTLEKEVESTEGTVWRGLACGANECPADTTPEEQDALLLGWAREIAPDGEQP